MQSAHDEHMHALPVSQCHTLRTLIIRLSHIMACRSQGTVVRRSVRIALTSAAEDSGLLQL
jgi:hypothetical protein